MSDIVVNTGIFLSGEQYWKWRFYAAAIEAAKLKEKERDCMRSLMELNIENTKLKLDIYKNGQLARTKLDVVEATAEYERVRKEISEELGVDLKDGGVCDATYEVKLFKKSDNS